MKPTDVAEVHQNLGLLVGKKLSRSKNAGNMNLFGFGESHNVNAESTMPEFSLHVQCPWRIEDKKEAHIVTGSSDYYVPAPDNEDKSWEPTNGKGSLQRYRMLELLHGKGSSLEKNNNNTSGQLVVTEVMLLPYYGLQIDLSPHYRLTVFPSGSADEQWRLLLPGTPSTHYVLQNMHLCVE